MNDCILHIGMHKTGSTSIQFSLANFSDARMLYARLGTTPNHSLAMYTLFAAEPQKHRLHAGRRSPEKMRAYIDGIRKDLDNAIAAARGRTLIVSGEGMCGLQAGEVQNLADELRPRFDRLTVAGYVRPPAAFMSSGFQERVKSGRFGRFELQRYYRNYRATFEKFDAAFGRDNVSLWKFDPASFPERDVVKDFCARLRIPLTARQSDRRNESLSREAVKLLYTYYRFRPAGPDQSGGEAPGRLANLLSEIGADKFRLSPKATRPILEENKGDIDWMERRLGASLHEALDDERPGDIATETDLLRPDAEAIAKLKEVLGSSAPKDVAGKTPAEVALLVDALNRRPRPFRLRRWGRMASRWGRSLSKWRRSR
jgi:hypothetical protein